MSCDYYILKYISYKLIMLWNCLLSLPKIGGSDISKQKFECQGPAAFNVRCESQRFRNPERNGFIDKFYISMSSEYFFLVVLWILTNVRLIYYI